MKNATAINAIDTLTRSLSLFNIPHYVENFRDGAAVLFPWTFADVTATSWTYGSERGNVESFGFPWDGEDVTMDTPHKMATRIICLFYNIK